MQCTTLYPAQISINKQHKTALLSTLYVLSSWGGGRTSLPSPAVQILGNVSPGRSPARFTPMMHDDLKR